MMCVAARRRFVKQPAHLPPKASSGENGGGSALSFKKTFSCFMFTSDMLLDVHYLDVKTAHHEVVALRNEIVMLYKEVWGGLKRHRRVC
jgi:hypothetical protein